MDWIWKSILLALTGIILLRIAGRKSISQMSVATTVIMISIGTTIVQPIANHELGKAIGSAAVFIAILIVVEQLQLKFNIFEQLMSGSSKMVVEDGKVIIPNLRRMRYTVDHLEMQLRQNGISSINDLESATVEPNGQLGYVLKRHARPVTIGELEELLNGKVILDAQQAGIQASDNNKGSSDVQPEHPRGPLPGNGNSTDIFEEVGTGTHVKPIDPKLQ